MSFQENKKSIIQALRDAHVAHVEASFQGGGDSGDIERSVAKNADGEVVDLGLAGVRVELIQTGSVYNIRTKRHDRTTEKVVKKLEEAINGFMNDALEQTGIDWYNNEGGQGSIEMNVKDGTVVVHMEQNVTTTENSEHEL
jgi:hypothetical protein